MIEQTIEKEAHFDSPLFSFDLPKPVLIVEDDSIIQNRLKKLLIDLNYNNEDLIFSNTLDQSIASVKAKKIAFALVDLGLPDGYDALRWSKLKKVADQTSAQAIDQYKFWFGENSRVTEQNIKSQFESQLRMSQLGDTQALSLLSRVGPILMQKQIIAQQVNYDASTLAMSLKAKSADDLQGLTQQLNQQGFQAELGSVQADSIGAIGVVKVK